jgi:hypothetical protein
MPNTLIHRNPKNELQAKFSMEFCMAILLLERRAGLAQFTDAVVNRADVQRMMKKIEFGVHPVAEAAGYEKMTTIIDIELTDGRTVSGRADFGKGSPANPMSDDEVADKFRECASWGGLPDANIKKVIDAVFHLEKLKSTRELTRLLAIPPARKKAAKTKKSTRIPPHWRTHEHTTPHRIHARRRDRHRPGNRRQTAGLGQTCRERANHHHRRSPRARTRHA